MKYTNIEITIKDLIELIKKGDLNLRPSYQRNFIWSSKDQRLLIDSIHKGYPMPNFFFLKTKDNQYEMVDGQQRATTIFKYYIGDFKDSQNKKYSDYPTAPFLEYKLNVVLLEDFNESVGESKEEFFYLVNKRGVHLNPAEVNQAYYHNSDFLTLVNQSMDYQPLIDMDLFTDKTKIRMNDRSLIEEIMAFLFVGITDKRNAVEALFKDRISEDKLATIYSRFCRVIDRIYDMSSSVYPINKTRYKQRNDFFTLFCWVNNHIEDVKEVYEYQYKLLVFISQNEFISPSNEECLPFKEYAINCVSQSNSKKAREERLCFFDMLLCNTSDNGNYILNTILNYFCSGYDVKNTGLISVGHYKLMNMSLFQDEQ